MHSAEAERTGRNKLDDFKEKELERQILKKMFETLKNIVDLNDTSERYIVTSKKEEGITFHIKIKKEFTAQEIPSPVDQMRNISKTFNKFIE
jgi:hypothetical protein